MYNVFVLAAKPKLQNVFNYFVTPTVFFKLAIAISSVQIDSISVWQCVYSKVKSGKDCRISPTTFEGLVLCPLKCTVRLMCCKVMKVQIS